jgi:hypothetical protein
MFIAVRMNITDEQGSRACLMNTADTPFAAGQPVLVMAAILLSPKKGWLSEAGHTG